MKDVKSFLVISFIIFSFLLAALTVLAQADEHINTSARASVLYNPDTQSFLYKNNESERLPMASTTKIMTALLSLEMLSPDDQVKIDKGAVGIEGSSIYLSEGDVIRAEDLIYSVLLQSANDAAAALAIHIAGSVEDFAELMNARASVLNLKDTSFSNPHGLDDEMHYTSAHDLAIMASEALKNQSFAQICSTKRYSFFIGDSKRTINNHNKMLQLYEDAIGVKTGYTKKSGRCLVSAAKRNGISLIAVTLNAPDDWRDHRALLDFGFSNLTSYRISDICNLNYRPKIINANYHELSTSFEDAVLVGLKNDKFTVQIDAPRYKAAPIKTGDQIGTIYVFKNNTLYSEIPIVSNEGITPTENKRFSFIHSKRN